jgi:putative glutathione S-transferase
VPGSDRSIHHLHELYTLGHPGHTGRATVPVLWDKKAHRVVSNESSDIVLAFDRAFGDVTLSHPALKTTAEALDSRIYDALNNGVYRAGFARSQDAFDAAANDVFDMLTWLDWRLARSRFLHGSVLTLSDIRLFPTLVRFDLIYHFLFGLCRLRVRDLPHVWGYTRDLLAHPGIRTTVDIPQMVEAAYLNDSRTSTPVVPTLPGINWDEPSGRDVLGAACLATRDGALIPAV